MPYKGNQKSSKIVYLIKHIEPAEINMFNKFIFNKFLRMENKSSIQLSLSVNKNSAVFRKDIKFINNSSNYTSDATRNAATSNGQTWEN